jgi:hypothetical protein
MGRDKISDARQQNKNQEQKAPQTESERKTLTQRMPKNLVQKIDDVADSLGVSRNAAINLLVKDAIEDWE